VKSAGKDQAALPFEHKWTVFDACQASVGCGGVHLFNP
jgi:hypothetical protein